MESSEDDAGTATSASRRASAREKDVRHTEEGNATSSMQQETSEARTSCQTPAMSEENYDGDSVPSPSSHDVNTSTEAILDMIDEFVDGPGAPKRLPHSLEAGADTEENSDEPQLPTTAPQNDTPQVSSEHPVTSAKSEKEPHLSDKDASTECTSQSDSCVSVSVESPHTCSSAVEGVVSAESTLSENLARPSDDSEVLSECPPLNIPSSSVVETVQSISDVNECQTQERTVKCVSSSDNRDNVTVESAESTSSDGKSVVAEPVTRSPLRRRLVRPAPSDRRPDSTVSSTVDIHTTEQMHSENVAKDVSSSSDAVPPVHGNVKLEEIRNVSEISVCKAETSMSPPKKIKLIRQKTIPGTSNKDNTQDKQVLLLDLEQCQSTSQDNSVTTQCESQPESLSCASGSQQLDEVKNESKDVTNHEICVKIIPTDDSSLKSEELQECVKSSSITQGTSESTPQDNVESKCEQELKLDSNIATLPEEPISKSGTSVMEVFSDISKCDDSLPEHSNVSPKQVPKLTIKLGNKPSEEIKSPIPKVTIKPIKPPVDEANDSNEQIPNVTKLNIKPILKPSDLINDLPVRPEGSDSKPDDEEKIPLVTKINIKPIPKPPEKINDVHRKSSSSEISESEYSENEESTSTSDQASASDQGSSNVIPKVTIKLGKPGTQSEGKFYTEKNISKRTTRNMQHSEKDEPESVSKLKLIISPPEEKQVDKIPKLTIKNVTKCESQPLSPKLTIKPLKPPDNVSKDGIIDFSEMQQIPKLKIATESFSSSTEIKENTHVPKITIKPVTRTDVDNKILKKSTVVSSSPEHIPVVTKLNIKPILKPSDSTETSEISEDKVPVVSKLNIKPLIKPKDSEINSSIDDIPKITKLNIKPLKIPEGTSSEAKDCDDLNAVIDGNSIPIITKLNIKPIVKPIDEDTTKDSENQSSETGNSSDENTDHIPVITKLNIKPIVKPNDMEEMPRDETIPIITKLNIKPLVKPDESTSPLSPKKDNLKTTISPLSPKKDGFKIDTRSSSVPVITKLNIKPIIKPDDIDQQKRDETRDEIDDEKTIKNPPLLMKINMKAVTDSSSSESPNIDKKINNIDDKYEHTYNNISESLPPPTVKKLNIKPVLKSETNITELSADNMDSKKPDNKVEDEEVIAVKADLKENAPSENSLQHNSIPEKTERDFEECVPQKVEPSSSLTQTNITQSTVATEPASSPLESSSIINSISKHSAFDDLKSNKSELIENCEQHDSKVVNQSVKSSDIDSTPTTETAVFRSKQPSTQNCTLLKKLLENTDDSLDKKVEEPLHSNCSSMLSVACKDTVNCQQVNSGLGSDKNNSNASPNMTENRKSPHPELMNDSDSLGESNIRPIQDLCKEASENIKNPLEINVSEKVISQSSGQDSPRIILKINKTDHGPSAKIITEDISRPDSIQQQNYTLENTQENINDKHPLKKNIVNSRRKQTLEVSQSAPVGKRLRSSRVVENTDKSPIVRRNVGKRPSTPDTTPPQNKEPELSVLESKRLKLGQLLSNKSLTVTPVKVVQTSPTNKFLDNKNAVKPANHTSLLNNENCSKNGNSKLHNILSNLQAKQMQALPLNDINCLEKSQTSEVDSNISTGSSDVVEIVRVENCHPEVQEMIINDSFDFNIANDDMSQDPLEVDTSKSLEVTKESHSIPQAMEMTPQPKKRGRPRKLPVSEGAKPINVTLPVPALEERPQRSLRLSRDRPAILAKPKRGRGRGRGRVGRPRLDASSSPAVESEPEPVAGTVTVTFPLPAADGEDSEAIDPTSSRIKLPRMTEALDKMPSACSTPLSSRRRSSTADLKLFGETHELKVVLDTLPKFEEPYKSPESSGSGGGSGSGRGGRGGRGRGRGGRTPARTPRGRGRGRGGGRGAMYMKETLGIYGRVCGPATTTVQLFEEETCMMDDNATPAKPSHLLDEDSQSSVKSSTNESSKMKKSKFADLFDSNKVWTAADVKEYMWPPPEKHSDESQVMMIQEQVAMFLSVKSFKRRYPELKRRTIVGDEREYVLARGLVTEALCDLGITAVDASEVLDIMLSDYPHKYEEYRSHQRERQLANVESFVEEIKKEAPDEKTDVKMESKLADQKPEPPKVDPEKTRQDMAAAAIASASEWNARLNALRRPACADLQSLTVQRRQPAPAPPASPLAAPPAAPPPRVRPPAGFYPHALLPGQYQHWYRVYTSDQLRYFPLSTATAAPAAPSSDEEADAPRSSSGDSDAAYHHTHHQPKRKRLTKVKRSSQAEAGGSKDKDKDKDKDKEVKEEPREDEETCRVCKLRLEANRKYTHERFLVCSTCNSKQHAACVQLGAASARRAREYAWQCGECKCCGECGRRARDDDTHCDLCDRAFHAHCLGRAAPTAGRWHCAECAICKSCGARDPAGLGAAPGPVAAGPGPATGPGPAPGPAAEAEWHHQTRRGPGGHKLYSHSLCTPCARVR